jgi:hypothetical protein
MHLGIATHIGSSLPDLLSISGPLPIVASANLRLLYLLLNREHINHIQVLGFLPFAYPSMRVLPLECDSCPIILLHLYHSIWVMGTSFHMLGTMNNIVMNTEVHISSTHWFHFLWINIRSRIAKSYDNFTFNF